MHYKVFLDGAGFLLDSELVSTLVKTDSNWLLRMLALLWLSLLKKPSSFYSGDTPVDSFSIDFFLFIINIVQNTNIHKFIYNIM